MSKTPPTTRARACAPNLLAQRSNAAAGGRRRVAAVRRLGGHVWGRGGRSRTIARGPEMGRPDAKALMRTKIGATRPNHREEAGLRRKSTSRRAGFVAKMFAFGTGSRRNPSPDRPIRNEMVEEPPPNACGIGAPVELPPSMGSLPDPAAHGFAAARGITAAHRIAFAQSIAAARNVAATHRRGLGPWRRRCAQDRRGSWSAQYSLLPIHSEKR